MIDPRCDECAAENQFALDGQLIMLGAGQLDLQALRSEVNVSVDRQVTDARTGCDTAAE